MGPGICVCLEPHILTLESAASVNNQSFVEKFITHLDGLVQETTGVVSHIQYQSFHGLIFFL